MPIIEQDFCETLYLNQKNLKNIKAFKKYQKKNILQQMDKLQKELLVANNEIHQKLNDTKSYTKLEQLKQLNFDPTPIHVAKNLLTVRQNPQEFAQQNKLEFKLRQTLFWQPSNKDAQSQQQPLPQSQIDTQQLIDNTNAISFIESSKTEESQMQQSQQSQQSKQSTTRKLLFKSRISKQPSDSSIWKKPLKQITKIILTFKQDSKAEFFVVIKYEDASTQLEPKSIDQNKKIQWDCQVKFEITEEQTLYLLIVQQQQGKGGQQNVLQQAINIQTTEKQFLQDVQLKYLKNSINATLQVDFN